MKKSNDILPTFIEIENIDNSKELKKIEEHIKKLIENFRIKRLKGEFNHKTHNVLHENVVDTLLYLGELSVPIFELGDSLEEKYCIAYKSAPMIAKNLWLEHVKYLNKDYDLLKERCYRLIELMDMEEQKYNVRHDQHKTNVKVNII